MTGATPLDPSTASMIDQMKKKRAISSVQM